MQGPRPTASRTPYSSGALRIVLALLLALAPLLSTAKPLALAAGAVTPGSASAPIQSVTGDAPLSQMPCHGGSRAAAPTNASPVATTHPGTHPASPPGDSAADTPPCPHCSGDASASACQCCGCTAPAGLAVPIVATHPDVAHARGFVALLPDCVARACAERLFRPPIQSH